MPGTNLTRDEAATRAALLDVTSYSIDLDLTTGDKTFGSTTTIRFTSTEAGAETFARVALDRSDARGSLQAFDVVARDAAGRVFGGLRILSLQR